MSVEPGEPRERPSLTSAARRLRSDAFFCSRYLRRRMARSLARRSDSRRAATRAAAAEAAAAEAAPPPPPPPPPEAADDEPPPPPPLEGGRRGRSGEFRSWASIRFRLAWAARIRSWYSRVLASSCRFCARAERTLAFRWTSDLAAPAEGAAERRERFWAAEDEEEEEGGGPTSMARAAGGPSPNLTPWRMV